MYSPLLKQLIDALQQLPGVGPKSAARMAFQLLSENGRQAGNTISDTLKLALEKVGHCQSCRNFTEAKICQICSSHKRHKDSVCVVENPADLVAVDQTASFNGVFYVLHGRLSPIDGIGPNELGIDRLIQQIKTTGVKEVILATNATMEGEATAHYIAGQLKDTEVHCSRLAHGVPIGGELEYLDSNTLAHALQSRLEIEV